ncbi:glycosyltransferase family protein [Catenisphaera adipataccumulans]|nr:hypothetical protein [Catenisphaera adipataccumulans]
MMKEKIIVLDDTQSRSALTKFNAGSKARSDIDRIFSAYPIYFFGNYNTKKYISRILFYQRAMHRLKKEDPRSIYIMQYPEYILPPLIKRLYQFASAHRTIVYIHDLNSLRIGGDNREAIKEEISRLNTFSVIIAHNRFMHQWLTENGCTRPIVDLNLFDYLAEEPKEKPLRYDIGFAGNLEYEKSKFLYKAMNRNPEVTFEVFGKGWDKKHVEHDNHHYQGTKDPDEIVDCFHSRFGLIWDGDTTDTCAGRYGAYERYNNPHKLSLYMAAGMPAIVWQEAAIADFVKKNGVGIVLHDLNDLHSELAKITPDQYAQMRKNAQAVGDRARAGVFSKTAVRTAVKYLRKEAEHA